MPNYDWLVLYEHVQKRGILALGSPEVVPTAEISRTCDDAFAAGRAFKIIPPVSPGAKVFISSRRTEPIHTGCVYFSV